MDNCERWQQWTLATARFAKLRHTTPNLPFDAFCFDLLTGLPKTERGMVGIMVGMCRLTGFCILRPFAEKDSWNALQNRYWNPNRAHKRP
jgi:hypothetical protein